MEQMPATPTLDRRPDESERQHVERVARAICDLAGRCERPGSPHHPVPEAPHA